MEREVVVDGKVHLVEYAVEADGNEPARGFLEALQEGEWEPDDGGETIDPDLQIKDVAKVLAMIRRLGDLGLPTGGRDGSITNQLEDGVWEFKKDLLRLSWYDTDGGGAYEPKRRLNDIADSEFPEDLDSWWFPKFDEFIRLGHCFPKRGDRAGELNINESIRVREEDLAHDRSA